MAEIFYAYFPRPPKKEIHGCCDCFTVQNHILQVVEQIFFSSSKHPQKL